MYSVRVGNNFMETNLILFADWQEEQVMKGAGEEGAGATTEAVVEGQVGAQGAARVRRHK